MQQTKQSAEHRLPEVNYICPAGSKLVKIKYAFHLYSFTITCTWLVCTSQPLTGLMTDKEIG
jgi:hypothetical protein